MKHYRQWEETQTVQRRELEKVTCDWCQAPVEVERGYDTRDFEISFSIGSSYGNDGGHKEGWEVEDLCNTCVKKLRALLEKQGIRITPVKMDW